MKAWLGIFLYQKWNNAEMRVIPAEYKTTAED